MPTSDSVVEQLLAESEALLQSIIETPSSPCASASSSLSSSIITLPAAATASNEQSRMNSTLASLPAVPTTKPKRTRNSTRDRQQSELQFLRRHVCELEAEVAGLLKHRDGAPLLLAARPASSSAWQRLSQRQKKARTMCEHEKRLLTSQVVERATLIRAIRKLLLTHQSVLHQRNTLNTRTALAQTGWDEAAAFARLKQDAIHGFERLDRVLAENGIHRHGGGMPDPIEDNVLSHVYDRQSQQFVSRLVSTRAFPFDVHATSNATWHAIVSALFTEVTTGSVHPADKDDPIALQSSVQVVERSDSTYAVSYVVTLNVNGADLVVRARDVVTRFSSATQAGESVFVWETALEHACVAGHADCQAALPPQIRGSGWLVIQQPQNACSSSVLRSVFEFHTTTAADYDSACMDFGNDNDEDAVKVQVMKAWAAMGEGCVDTIALHVDKSLLVC